MTWRIALAAACFCPAIVVAQIDSTTPYTDPAIVRPVEIAPTTPGWVRTGVGVQLLSALKMEQYLRPPEHAPAPAYTPFKLAAD